MQRIATKVFIIASILFGIFGLLMVLTFPDKGQPNSDINMAFARFLQATVFVILPSFALSVAGKYLNGKK